MNTINKLELFPISVWQIHSGIDTTNLHTVSLSLKDNLHYGKAAGGYQGGDNFDSIDEFKPVIQFITDSIKKIFNSNFTFLDMWISIAGKGDYNNIHNHPPFSSLYHNHPMYSGVFYIKTFNNSGNLNIHSSTNVTNKHTLNPIDGELILFNSSTYHSVTPSESNEDRICLVFNIALDDK